MRKLYLLSGLFLLISGNALRAQLTITEIHYNSDSTRNSGDWFELHNRGASAVDLSLYRFRDSSATGLFLAPPGTSIPAMDYLVFCTDTLAFDAIYSIPNRIGNLGYGFNNNADGIRIFDNTNAPVLELFYSDSLPWPMGADGYGRTLELSSPSLDPAQPQNWRTGCVLGSPGGPFVPCTGETIVVSEFNYKSSPVEDAGDWFEIRNISNAPVNIGNYRIRDDQNENLYIIPANTILAPQGSVVVFDNPTKFNNQFPFVANKIGPFFFNLSGGGDCIRIYNTADEVIFSACYFDEPPWPEQPDGEGFTLEADTNFSFSRDVNDVSSWFVGCPEGSPGRKYDMNCLGAAPEEIPATISVYPNPATTYINIDRKNATGEFEAVLTDMGGRRTGRWSSPQQIDVSAFAPGIYILTVSDKDHSYYTRIQLLPYD